MLLDKVLERGSLKVSISSLDKKDNGEFSGFHVDLSRAIAAAIFGDANKVEFVVENLDDSLNSVANAEVDLAATGVAINSGLDAALNIDYGPVYLYDNQALLVRESSNIDNVVDLQDKKIGVVKNTASEQNLASYFKDEEISFISQTFESTEEMLQAYDRGEIDAISSNRSTLFSSLEKLTEPEQHKFLDEELSKAPLALAIPENDSEWGDIVRWVTYALIQAEETGLTSEDIDDFVEFINDSIDAFETFGLDGLDSEIPPTITRFLGLGEEDNLGEALGLPKDFVVQIIKQVGNYGEIYERHFPGLERDRNSGWQNDGLLYSPPFAGKVEGFELIDNDSRNLLQEIKERGFVQLGVIGNNPGFSFKDSGKEWKGFDIDLGKAVSAAVFGSPNELKVIVEDIEDLSQGFEKVANGNIDIFAAGVTHNLARDAALGVDFSPTYIYDYQDFLVRKDSEINSDSDLNGRAIGIIDSATVEQNIDDFISLTDSEADFFLYSDIDEMFAEYESGEIDAISTNQTIISRRIPEFENPEEHQILEEGISKEPLALVIDENQSEWADIVRWVTHTLVQAEEFGITSENIDELIANNTDENSENDSKSDIRAFLGIEGSIGEALGLSQDFAVNIIKAVGNYGEMYERNFDSEILPRDKNKLYTDSGLQYSAPFSNASVIDSEQNQDDDISVIDSEQNQDDNITEDKTPEESSQLTLSQEGTNFLSIDGDLNLAKLQLSLTRKDIDKGSIHEIGLFVVDDSQGSVNGLLPNAEGYLQAALERSQTIFSVIADDFVPNPTRTLENFSGKLLSFYLIQNGTTDEVINNPSASEKVLFGSSENVLQITSLDNNQFQLVFEDGLGDLISDLTLNVSLSNTTSVIGSKMQGQTERELIDLTEFSGQSIETVFPIVQSEAAYNNTVGFYRLENEQGAVLDPVTGELLNPEDEGYTQAAIRSSQEYGMSFDRNSSDFNATVEGGYLFAPFLIADGTVSEILDNNLGNDQPVYFAYMQANSDGFDHIRLLGDNTWGFEDLAGGGDGDYNDIAIQAQISVA